MEKRIKVTFREQAKAVVTEVTIEHSGDAKSPEVLQEAKDLFAEASQHAKIETMRKLR